MTKINRRKFFGAAAGAAVATQIRGGMPTASGGLGMPATYADVPTQDPFYWINRKKDLERKIRGEFTEDEEYSFRTNGPYVGSSGDADIEALRSVSPGCKHRMRADFYARRERNRWIENAKYELAQMLEKRLGL